MFMLHKGQCGLCVHFGEDHPKDKKLMQVRTTHRAPEDMVDDCGLPHNAEIHLQVAAISGCNQFEPVPAS